MARPRSFSLATSSAELAAMDFGAQVYQNQPLVIVNASGEATPEEIIGLETEVIQAIESKYGITLHPEVEHI